MLRHIALALCVLGTVPASPAGEESVLLRYRFDEDEKRIQQSTLTLEQEQTVNEQTFKTLMSNRDVSYWTLEKVDDEGRFEIRTENERMHVELEIGPLGKYEFDSESTERDKASTLGAALTPLYERLSGAYLWMTISPRGEVVATRGYAELVKDAVGDNPIAQQFSGGGSDEAHKASIAQFFVELPEDPITVGDTWTSNSGVNLPKIGKVDSKTTYELKKIVKEGDHVIAEISATHEIAANIELEQAGAKVTGRLQTEKASGTLRFDVTAGRIISRDESYTIAGTLGVAVAGQNLTIPMKQTQRVKTRLLEKLPE